jgi:hypothetical protein
MICHDATICLPEVTKTAYASLAPAAKILSITRCLFCLDEMAQMLPPIGAFSNTL